MDLYDFAKCGLLENMVSTSIGLPLWQTGLTILSIVFSQVAGTVVGYPIGQKRLPLRALQSVALVAFAVLLTFAVAAASVNGVQYDLFIARMVKDSLYCTYFGADRGLSWDQASALSIAVIGNIVEAALLVCGRRPLGLAKTIASRSICGASCLPCVMFDGMPLVLGTALFHICLACLLTKIRCR